MADEARSGAARQAKLLDQQELRSSTVLQMMGLARSEKFKEEVDPTEEWRNGDRILAGRRQAGP